MDKTAWTLIVLALGVGACTEPSAPSAASKVSAPPKAAAAPPAPESSGTTAKYHVPLRSEREAQAALTASCRKAQQAGKPWLLELSADWCGDCRALHSLKQQSPLREELAQWQSVVVNVGEFDRHEALRKRLGVKAIAHWAVMKATRCEQALEAAPVLRQRTLEPTSGQAVSAASLAAWLRSVRG